MCFTRNMSNLVKNYEDKERAALDTVRKYPLYSVDKLAEKLPGISRHSIQRVLEKNNLSTIEKRLEFSATKRPKKLLPEIGLKVKMAGFFKKRRVSLDIFKTPLARIKEQPKVLKVWARGILALFLAALVIWQGVVYFFGKMPEIILDYPSVDYKNEGERLFVSGKVSPKGSLVTVNESASSLNGDGTFTALVRIPIGESVLKIEAVNRLNKNKRSQLLRLVNRILSNEELQAQKEGEAKKKREAIDKAAYLERTVNDLLAAKNATAEKKMNVLKVLNSRIKEEAGFYSVTGEIMNIGKADVSWVMITANFYNESGSIIDTKYGFATDFGQVVKPGGTAAFETQPTTKQFDHYSLGLSWEEGLVAGAETGGATVSAEITGTSE